MKKKVLLISIILAIQLSSAATIFSDNFESGSLSGWTLTKAAGANDWTASQTDPFAGSWHAQSQPQSTTEPASVIERTISTSGYSSIIVNYGRKLIGLDVADEFQAEWFDGSSWTILEQTGGSSADDTSYVLQSFSLPSGADNNANFKIKFECTAGAVSEFCRVDNVNIEGNVIDTTPPTITVNSPQQAQFINTNSVTFNITLNENGTARYTLNNGITNITLSTTDNQNFNHTNTSISDAQYTVQFYVNDSAGNINNTVTSTFTIDTTLPLISITTPQNISYNTLQTQLNYSVFDINVQSCWYSTNNGQTNATITCGQNVTGLSSNQGSNTWQIYANDSAGNTNSSLITFSLDSIAPNINFTNPTEASGTIITRNNILINVTSSDTNLKNITIFLYNSTSFLIYQNTTNNSIHFVNISSLNDGLYFFNATSYDSLGNLNSTETRNVTIDTTAPIANYISPTQVSGIFTNRNYIEINITASDINLNIILIRLFNSTMQINSSLSIISPSYTNFSDLSDGLYFYNATINDSAGNINNTLTRNVTIDTKSPNISISKPADNDTFGINTSLQLNFSVSDTNLQSCWYHIDSSNNVTIPNCLNITFNTSDGSHTIYLYANDSVNNIAFSTTNFSVTLGPPIISLNSPLNNSYLSTSLVTILYTPTDVDLQACELWGNFNGTFTKNETNSTLTSGQQSSFNLNLSDNSYNWSIFCNDTLGNSAFSINRTFSIDTIFPSLTLTEPSGTKTSRNNIPIAFSASDLNIQACWYNVYRGSNQEIANTTIDCSSNSTTFNVTVDADFTLNFYVNDSAGNIKLSSPSFVVTTASAPPSEGGGGTSGGGGGGGAIASKSNITRELKIEINKLENIAIKRGTSTTTELEITNLERIFLNNCRLEISPPFIQWFINTQKKGFAAGEKFTFLININIPQTAEPAEYNPELTIRCDEGKKLVNMILVIFRNSFEVRMTNYERTVDSLKISYFVEEFARETHEISINYELIDFEGITVVKGNDKITINPEFKGENALEFKIPKDVIGEYDLKMTLTDGKTSAEINKRLVLGSKSVAGLAISDSNRRTLSIFGIILVSALLLFFISRFVYQKIKLKRLRKVNFPIEQKHGKKVIKLDLKER